MGFSSSRWLILVAILVWLNVLHVSKLPSAKSFLSLYNQKRLWRVQVSTAQFDGKSVQDEGL